MRLARFLVAVLLLAPPSTGWAQHQSPVEPGARVRLTASSLGIQRYVGTFVEVRADTLVVDSLRVAMVALTRLDVSRGRASYARTGALVGGGLGLGTGVIAGLWLSGICGFGGATPTPVCQAGVVAVSGVAVGAVVGAVGAGIGALIGAVIKSDRWEQVPLEQIRAGIVRLPAGRLGLGASLPF